MDFFSEQRALNFLPWGGKKKKKTHTIIKIIEKYHAIIQYIIGKLLVLEWTS